MLITCSNCTKSFLVKSALLKDGRKVKCGECGHIWLQMPKEDSEEEALFLSPEQTSLEGKDNQIKQYNLPVVTNYKTTSESKFSLIFAKLISFILFGILLASIYYLFNDEINYYLGLV